MKQVQASVSPDDQLECCLLCCFLTFVHAAGTCGFKDQQNLNKKEEDRYKITGPS